jgi:hypothetical protein
MRSRSVLIGEFNGAGVVYTVPNNTQAKWVLAFLSNSSGSTVSNVTVTINDGTTVPVIGSKSLNSGDFLLFGDGNYVILEEGDTISVSAGATGVSGILTIEETQQLVRTN